MNKLEILKQAAVARIEEIAAYQINIDNYKLAIPLAEEDPELLEFAEQLRDRLSAELLEQKKAKVILKVLQTQLGEE